MMPAFASAAEAAVATWLSPQPGQKISNRMVEVSVGYNTQSDQKVTRLELWVDGNFYSKKYLVQPESRGVASFTWDTAKFSNGPHDLVVKIFAGDQLINNVSGTGTVGDNFFDTRPPVVTFANIKSGDVLKGNTDIKLKVTDDSGENPIVTLRVDDALKLLKNTPPFVYKLDTTTYTDGSHKLETYACDSSGNKGNPAVVNVSFNNGIKPPVIATMKIENKTAPNSGAQDDEIIRSLPPVAVAPVKPEDKQRAAARSEDSASKTVKSALSAGPLAKSTGPEVRSAPAVSATPANVSTSAVSSDVRKSDAKTIVSAHKSSAEPSVMPEARTSAVESVKASVLPDAKVTRMASADRVKSAVEPASVSAPKDALISTPKSSELKRMASAELGSVRSEDRTSQLALSIGAAEERTSEPVAAGVKNVSASSVSSVKSSQISTASKKTGAEAPAVESKKQMKPVQVAMLAGVKNDPTHSAFLAPNPPLKDDKAKLEKMTVAVSSMVQLRDLFERLGGNIHWDAQTHSIIANAYDIRIEMMLGSNTVKVNGKEMQVSTAPYIENGRTYVDGAIYHKICDLLQAQGLAAFAGIK